ncbi:ATP synthase d subunit [Lunasporangiospora selenospora]|uniref:ATP synthase subunit d, mitochondrial n=1 Tax=Lunasporangiospora selenospora TaxID=979761 RepID=A0A9P6KFT9_9FUNG|nr:ATP synthase d subunit [Lunasporangiospora selenospora]
MSAVKAAAAHIDWTKLSTSLGLKAETVAALTAFRKRNEEARRILSDLKEQKTAVDFAQYRKVLKNQAIVDEIEKSFKSFKPTTYDVQTQIKSIEAVEVKALERAKSTASKVESELADLQATLKNIETSRPIEELTVDDVLKSRPEIAEKVDALLAKGKWNTKGYNEKFGYVTLF